LAALWLAKPRGARSGRFAEPGSPGPALHQERRVSINAALAVNDQIREARTRQQPLGWLAIEHEFNLTRKERVAHQYLSAVRIKAEHERRTFKAIALDPTVDLRADTLRKSYATAKLPTGQTWAQYIDAYRSGALQKLTELQAAEGAQAAQDLYALLKQGQRVLGKIQDELERYAFEPPQEYSVRGLKGVLSYPTTERQLLLAFPGQTVGAAEADNQRFTTHFIDWLMDTQERVFKAATPLQMLLTKVAPADEAEDETRLQSPEELRQKIAEMQVLGDELDLYEGAAA
jgi:hypothetical protein